MKHPADQVDWCTGKRLPGSVTPLRGWADLAFRLVVMTVFAEWIVALAYVGYLLSPSHELRVLLAVFVGGFVIGLAVRRSL